MMFFRRALIACVLGLGWSWVAWGGADPALELGLPADVAAAMQSIDPERIRTHVKFLADDLLEGRGTGTRGGDIAANYIAAQFALYGLKPAGDGGSYLQKVDFTGVHTQPSTSMSLVPSHGAPIDLKFGEDFVTTNQTQTDVVDVDAPIVFVGYGIDAPEYHWNDFKGIDVKGKVLLLIVNDSDEKSGLPNMAAMSGVIRSLTKAVTSAPKAAPMTTATARSTTLPRKMNSLKPLSMALPPPRQQMPAGETRRPKPPGPGPRRVRAYGRLLTRRPTPASSVCATRRPV